MKKNKFFNYYFNNVFDESTKKVVYDSFKRKNYVKIINCNNYYYVSEFENKIKHNDKKNSSLLEEVKKIENGTIDWYSLCSNELQDYLNDYSFYLYQIELNRFCENSDWEKYSNYVNNSIIDEEDDINFNAKNPLGYMYDSINKTYNDIYNFYDSHFCLEDVYDIDTNEFKEEVLEKIITGKRIPCDREIYNKVIYYSLCESEEKFVEFENGLFKLNDYAYNKFIVNGESIPLTTKQKLYKSIFRTINQFSNLCRCNADKFTKFITLTFAEKENQEKYIELNNNRSEDEYDLKFKFVENATDYEECVEIMKKFLEVLKKNMKKRGFEFYYIGVPEYQKNGNIHYHFLTNDIPKDLLYEIPKWLDYDSYEKHYRNDKGLLSWKYGKSTIEDIEDKARMQSYISKYMLKSLKEIDETIYVDRLYKRRYYSSLNLIKPIVEYDDNFEIDNYYSVYEFKRYNSFNDTDINNKIYQVKQLNARDRLMREVNLFDSVFEN